MSLNTYLEESYTLGSLVDPVDTFTGDGSTTTFTLVYKGASRLASTIQAYATQYYQYNGGFTKDVGAGTFTLSSAPGAGQTIVAPGVVMITAGVFDQESVDGVTNPRVDEVPFYLGDPSTPHLNIYTNMPQYAGIRLTLTDLISSVGADSSWCQLACAAADGTALTYAATGAALYTAALQAFGTFSASTAAGASAILCTSASTFIDGDYIIVNIGNATQEIRKISSHSTTTLNLSTGFDFSHASSESIFTMGRKFWMKVTIPEDAANNEATNYYDISLRRQGRINSRV